MDLRTVFGLPADAVVTPGPRGALGRIWRVQTGAGRYAVKEIFGTPPSRATIEAELAFTRCAVAAGVRVPVGRPGPDGEHLQRAPGGRWLRLHDWVDVEPGRPLEPAALGDLLGRLHAGAPAAAAEPDGSPPDPWYERVPPAPAWPRPTAPAWSARLVERLRTLPALSAVVTPADPAAMVLCHRDLHPENVLAGPGGVPVVVDLDQVGPAVPVRELARFLFDWYCDGPADIAAMRAVYGAYLRAGGPGRITGPADFTMLVATRLNFLLRQVRIALDPGTPPGDLAWAEQEIDEGLRLLPTPEQLATVPALLT